MNDTLKQIVLRKEEETYLFRFGPQPHAALVRVVGRFAADEQLSFTWHDAAMVCKQARCMVQDCGQAVCFQASAEPQERR